MEKKQERALKLRGALLYVGSQEQRRKSKEWILRHGEMRGEKHRHIFSED